MKLSFWGEYIPANESNRSRIDSSICSVFSPIGKILQLLCDSDWAQLVAKCEDRRLKVKLLEKWFGKLQQITLELRAHLAYGIWIDRIPTTVTKRLIGLVSKRIKNKCLLFNNDFFLRKIVHFVRDPTFFQCGNTGYFQETSNTVLKGKKGLKSHKPKHFSIICKRNRWVTLSRCNINVRNIRRWWCLRVCS